MLKMLLKMLSGLVSFWRGKATVLLFWMYHKSGFTCRECCDTGSYHAPPRTNGSPRAADYRTCNKCNAFLTKDESSYFTCHRCSAIHPRFAPRLAYASTVRSGVVLSMENRLGAEKPKIQALLGPRQAKALSQILLEPGSDAMGMRFDANKSMLKVAWDTIQRMAEITVYRTGREAEAARFTETQAIRLGEDIAGCLDTNCDGHGGYDA